MLTVFSLLHSAEVILYTHSIHQHTLYLFSFFWFGTKTPFLHFIWNQEYFFFLQVLRLGRDEELLKWNPTDFRTAGWNVRLFINIKAIKVFKFRNVVNVMHMCFLTVKTTAKKQFVWELN